MMQPQNELSIFDAAVHTTAGVTRTYGGIPNSDGAKIVGGTTHSAAGEKVYDHAKRAASPAGSASQGPPNTPKRGNEAADAQDDVVEHATQLRAPLSELPILDIADKDSKMHGGLLDALLSPPTTENNGERGALHCEKEHNNANAAATPEGSISRGILGRLRIRASTPDDAFTPCPSNSSVTLPTHIRQISVESRCSSQPGDGDEESGSTTTKATSHDGELSPHVEDQQTWEFFIGLGGSVPDNYNS